MNLENKSSIGRLEVLDESGARIDWGTAFLAGPRLILTAYHVVADRQKVEWRPRGARFEMVFTRAGSESVIVGLEPVDADSALDFAALELLGDVPRNVEPLVISVARPANHAGFTAWGFPQLNPSDGFGISGHVSDPHATITKGLPVLQLYTRQGAAPDAVMTGLSGAPCISEERALAIIRSFPTLDGRSVAAGTLYACPTSELVVREKLSGRLRLDPCAALPSLPDTYPWPQQPYRDLLPYTDADARVFFGRCREISRLLHALAEPSGGVILLCGQTGVGKSSLLRAGLMPRAQKQWETGYASRDQSVGLSTTFTSLSDSVGDSRPRLLVLDQVEEALTKPHSDHAHEISDLAAVITRHLADYPRDRVVLGFRKEWLAEIEQVLKAHGLSAPIVFVEPLTVDSIEEIVTGVARSPDLQQRWGLAVDDEVPEKVAYALANDYESSIAPALQVLLSRLWKEAIASSRTKPHFTLDLFDKVKLEGLGLEQILDTRLQCIYSEIPHVADGLALDLLEYHTTPLGTAETRTEDELVTRYRHEKELVGRLVRRLKEDFLLIDPRSDEHGASRLAHDALAPLIKSRYTSSGLTGQRATRILENRREDWRRNKTNTVLDEYDIAIVETGVSQMRSRTPAEERLFKASKKARNRRRRRRWLMIAGFVGMLGALFVLGVVAFDQQRRRAEEAKEASGRTFKEMGRRELLEGRNLQAAVYLSEAYASGISDAATRLLLGQSMLPIDSRIGSIQCFDEQVAYAQFSPDGSRIAATNGIGDVGVWDTDGELLYSSRGWPSQFSMKGALAISKPGGEVDIWNPGEQITLSVPGHSPAFSPDGNRIATVNENSVIIWDNHSGKQLVVLDDPRGTVENPVFDSRGNVIATTVGEQVNLWNSETGELRHSLAGSGDRFFVFCQSDSLLVTAGLDRFATVWSVDTGETISQLLGHEDFVVSAEFSPDCSRVLTAGRDGTARVWDAKSGYLIFALELPARDENVGVAIAKYTLDGKSIVTALGATQAAKLWDASTGSFIRSFPGHRGQILSIQFSPNGKSFMTGSEDGTVYIWSIGEQPMVMSGVVGVAALSNDGKLVAAGSEDGRFRVWDSQMGTVVWLSDADESTGNLRGSPSTYFTNGDSRLLVAWDEAVDIYRLPSRGLVASIPGRLYSLSRRSGRFLLHGDNGMEVRDTLTGELIKRLASSGSGIHRALISADGTRVVGESDAHVWAWDVVTGVRLTEFRDEARRWIYPAALTTDGGLLFAKSRERDSDRSFAEIWSTDDGRIVTELIGCAGERGATFSPDGSRLLTSMACDVKGPSGLGKESPEKTYVIWNVMNGHAVATLEGHHGAVWNADFSPSGEFIITGAWDGTAKIWETETGNLLASLDHESEILSVVFGVRGEQVLTTSRGKVRLWHLPLEARHPDEVRAIVDEKANYRIQRGGLVPTIPGVGRGLGSVRAGESQEGTHR